MDVNLIYLIIAGLVIGAIARLLMPGRDPIGFFGTLLVGVVGVVIGGILWDTLLPNNDNDGVAVFAGVVVAMILLWIYRRVAGRRTRYSR
ncbi:MAG TPA: GlsB/YeaQ/YmgE family stress response membrane protein [Actinomycetota bacterium]|jgi:uncharacterized membrane protein YeaQ/YmgE (transglycosylase-associated protein family)|nr:GlsB/YeaQ/YmgE family stress response membrane protein [Actinomycetota bacterium]